MCRGPSPTPGQETNARDGQNTISGTSMASPHVAGLGAYLLGLNGKQTVAALSSAIKSAATSGLVVNAGSGSPNLIAFNGNPSG